MNDARRGGYQTTIDLESKIRLQNSLHHNRWNNNVIKGAEAAVSLELLTVMQNERKSIANNKIAIRIDNQKVHNGITQTFKKEANARKTQVQKQLK